MRMLLKKENGGLHKRLDKPHCSTLKSLLHRTSFSSSKLASFQEIEIYYLSFLKGGIQRVAQFIVADTAYSSPLNFANYYFSNINFFANKSYPFFLTFAEKETLKICP